MIRPDLRGYGVGPLSPSEAAFTSTFLGAHLGQVQQEFDAVAVPGLVVGMAPGPRTSESLPMFPWPEGSAGGRLLAISRMPVAAYLGRLRRANLCDGAFRAAPARDRAIELERRYRTIDAPHVRIVLCGRRVIDSFFPDDAAPDWFQKVILAGLEYVGIPHPSGRNQMYNDPATVARVREAVRWAARWEG